MEQFAEDRQKVIVFTERLATAVYIERALKELAPSLRVANVVRETTTGDFQLKDFEQEVFDMIVDFAPEANSDKIANQAKRPSYDVLVTTDAYSAGVNLQDASVVINYDIAWTPETIIQRAGRILRFWTRPRQISFYIFVGKFQEDRKRKQESMRVEERFRRLSQRTSHAEKFSELPLIPESERVEYNSLGSLTDVTIEDLGFVSLGDIEEFSGVSRFLIHITELNQNLDYARSISDDVSSALQKGESHLLYLLLRSADKYVYLIYDVRRRKLMDIKEDELLELIRCSRKTQPSPIDPDIIERFAQAAKLKWIKQNHIEHAESVERICALYLLPENMDNAEEVYRSLLE